MPFKSLCKTFLPAKPVLVLDQRPPGQACWPAGPPVDSLSSELFEPLSEQKISSTLGPVGELGGILSGDLFAKYPGTIQIHAVGGHIGELFRGKFC